MKPALLLVPLALLASLPWTACTNASDGSPNGGNAGETSVAGQSGTDGGRGSTDGDPRFGDSTCRACQAEACASQEADCKSEPTCAGYLDCLDACPTTSEGSLEATCASACPRPAAASAEPLANAVDACRAEGSGVDCECGAPEATLELLNQDCSASTDENACFRCEEENCCETYATCKADPECDAFMACIKACDAHYTQCAVDCGEEHPKGIERGLERVSCLFTLCPDGDACGNGPLDPCVKCGNQRCTEEVLGCSLSYACQKINACTFDCTTDKCYADCYATDPEGAAEYKTYIGCVTTKCVSECG